VLWTEDLQDGQCIEDQLTVKNPFATRRIDAARLRPHDRSIPGPLGTDLNADERWVEATISSLMKIHAFWHRVGRMADIRNLSDQEISTVAGNCIRVETLKEANDRVANATARLPIFRHFHILDAVHSKSDGQKFEAAIPTINARHSAKYFGPNKCAFAYMLLANHVPLDARIVCANAHESYFVFDVLFNNVTQILPEPQIPH